MIGQMGGIPEGYPFILTTLTEPPEGSPDEVRERWERTCDNCGTYCPDDTTFFTGSMGTTIDGVRIEITFGACPKCAT